MTSWREWIVSDPGVLGGKPVVRGTRLSMAFLLGLLAQGWSREEILANYPQLSPEGLQAALAFGQEEGHFTALGRGRVRSRTGG